MSYSRVFFVNRFTYLWILLLFTSCSDKPYTDYACKIDKQNINVLIRHYDNGTLDYSDDRTVTKGSNVVENTEFLSFQITNIDNVLFAFQINNGGDYSFYGTTYIAAGWNQWNEWEPLGYCEKS